MVAVHPPAAVQRHGELAGPVGGKRVRMTCDQIGHACRGHEVREPRAQLARAGAP
jgi:hypothetical protein